MIVRPARQDELLQLQERIQDSDQEKVDLGRCLVWVAEEDGKVLGTLSARLVFQVEPLYIYPEVENQAKRRRASLMLYRAWEQWCGDRAQNGTGIHWFFAVIKNSVIKLAAKKLGMFRTYADCEQWAKDV